MIKILTCSIKQVGNQQLVETPIALPTKWAEKINRYQQKVDRLRSTTGYLLLLEGLQKYYGLMLDQIDIDYEDGGKPYLIGFPTIFFNISHAGEWVVLAISDRKIGIDVEEIKEIELQSLMENYFSEHEYRTYQSWSEADRLTNFYRLWTLKESYVKALGTGLSTSLKSFDIYIENNYVVISDMAYQVFECGFDKGYALSGCLKQPLTNGKAIFKIEEQSFDYLVYNYLEQK